jgi:hypothetical protein
LIFKNYGYRLLENQTVLFLEKVNVFYPNNLHFKLALVFLTLGFTGTALKRRGRWSWPLFLTALLFSIMACKALRNFTLFGLFSLPALSIGLRSFWPEKMPRIPRWADILTVLLSLIICAFTLFAYRGRPLDVGIGLSEKSAASAVFFKKNGLHGPIFNNYDIGGYLIYHLFPGERVFVDNRPEAYPESFFKEVYVPAQEDTEKWRALDARYRFNVIYFNYHDLTPWGQKFLIERVKDPDWAPVFADAYAVIFVRRSFENREIFAKYELPGSVFRVIKSEVS